MINKKVKSIIAAALSVGILLPTVINPVNVTAKTNSEVVSKEQKEVNKVNIAQGKRVYGRDDSKKNVLNNAIDGDINTYWDGGQYPSYLEVDLEKVYSLDSINLVNYEGNNRYYNYSIYGSTDGVNYDKIAEKTNNNVATNTGDIYEFSNTVEARYIRVLIEYCSVNESAHISELRVYGDETDKEGSVAPEINIPKFEDTEYAAPITTEETLSDVSGIVQRQLGAEYVDWFNFTIVPGESNMDYFEITNGENGKINITGNNGVSLATGLNHYLKYFCNVLITQTGEAVKMPETAPAVDTPVKKESPYENRYAYNYCTFSYTMAFWDEDEWQNGLDWLALNGVNLVLDVTAQDEVWRRFLTKLGYDMTEIKNWLVGPGYMAWQHMANMGTFGGPLPDQWFTDRTDLARNMQRKMKSLGMETVLQGYSGMIPADIQDKIPDLEVLQQGKWCDFQRPAMLMTDSEDYDRMAAMFYECQDEVYGKDATNYYATDPFHEGGTDGGMSRATIYAEILESMKSSDEDAIWVIQSWRENPAQDGLNGIANRDDLLILDLYAEVDPRWDGSSHAFGHTWDSDEFDGTPWVWNMLNNFGGRMGLHGQLETLATEIPKALKVTSADGQSKMKGIGMTPEALESNPVLYDLLYEMAWTTEEVDVDEWLRGYVERRYGKFTENAYEAWKILNDTAYAPRSDFHEGAPDSLINARPKFGVTGAYAWGTINPKYDKVELEKAIELLFSDYDELKDNEGYMYDITDSLRQVLANSSAEYYRKFTALYKAGDKEGFIEYADKFLELIKLQEQILSTEDTFLVGRWIEDAKEIAYDDFSRDMFEINARALITTWGAVKQAEDGALRDYSNRQWAGLTQDFYYNRWEMWIDSLKEAIETGSQPKNINWFENDWKWVLDNKEYTTEASNLDVKELGERVFEEFTVKDLNKPTLNKDSFNKYNLSYLLGVSNSAELQSKVTTSGDGEVWGKGWRAFDGERGQKDQGGRWVTRVMSDLPADKDGVKEWVRIDLGEVKSIESLKLYWYKNAGASSYNIQISDDNVNWTTVFTEENSDGNLDIINLGKKYNARYVKLGVKDIIDGHNAQCGKVSLYEMEVYDQSLISLKDKNAWANTSQALIEDMLGPAEFAIDEKPYTRWISPWDNHQEGPYYLAVNLGETYVLDKYVYEPIQVSDLDHSALIGNAIKYELYVDNSGTNVNSVNEENWTKVNEGVWNPNIDVKAIELDGVEASSVILKIVDGIKDSANKNFGSAGEIGLVGSKKQQAEIKVESVSNFSATASNNSVNLTWDAPKSTVGLVEYVIYKDGKAVGTVPAGETSYSANNLKANTIYGFKVTAKYSNNEESKPKSINIRTKK
ncbi:alpha-N-acetylglucosaminidase TIM-barrel domain-containing protein [Clostridium sp.]|uniref:alpha-N-acetylglucosaminidase TIM-barrel domain-containing protein n=1 Tax=Clostridium sp. TaxID=1506 RepID=UPI003F3DB989